VTQEYPRPPFDNEAARLAEQRWLEEEAGFMRRFVIAALWLAVGIVATYLAARFAYPISALLLCIGTLAGVAWVIYLCIQRHRTFIAIKVAGGMTKGEALSELLSRFGG
jgi:hypothetical protein